MEGLSSARRLSGWERSWLAVLGLVAVAFGCLVEYRSAFLSRRMGDLGVYVRAAWAVRSGEELYEVVDSNKWHYNYPPLLAVLMAPLADPPPGHQDQATLPYPVTVAVWYCLNLLFLALAVHWLATALERTSPDAGVRTQPAGCARWWLLRVLPVAACLPAIGHTLMRGQVNLLVLLLLAVTTAGLLLGQRFRAGLCLAGAICIKVFPAFLLLYPLWRRDGRFLTGCATGLLACLLVVPLLVFGPAGAVRTYQGWARYVLAPAFEMSEDRSRAQELLGMNTTDSQSFRAMLHNSQYPDLLRRPPVDAPWVRTAHWLLGGLMTLITLLAARRQRLGTAGTVLTLAALCWTMLLVSPVCHLHYFALSVLGVMGLIAVRWEGRSDLRLGMPLVILFTLHLAGTTLPHLPSLWLLRDLGISAYATLLLWGWTVVALWRGRVQPTATLMPAVLDRVIATPRKGVSLCATSDC